MPDATPTSTAPPSRVRRNSLWTAAQIILAAAVLGFVTKDLVRQWRRFSTASVRIDLHWGFLFASGAVVLLTYALLIETWRRILTEWGARMRFADATRIWCVSNLGKYVPGKIWQILAMGQLARRVEVPVAAAAGSAILNTVVNIGVGFAVAIIAGFGDLNSITGGRAALSIAFTVAAVAGILLLPLILPRAASVVERLTGGRSWDIATLPANAVFVAMAGNVAAWILYGLAFELLVYGTLGRANGSWPAYVSVYALSYVIGYLVFFIPGGFGTREAVQTTGLMTLGLVANPKEALMIALVSRLWLTVLEVLPGVVYLARETRIRPEAPRNGTNF